MKTSNEYNFLTVYKQFLSSENVLPATVRNYLSDIRHFWGYVMLQNKNQPQTDIPSEHLSQYFTKELIQQYKSYLLKQQTPLATINRHLSSLRNFCSFAISQQWLPANPMKNLENIYPHTPVGANNVPSETDWVPAFKADTTTFSAKHKQEIMRDITELFSIIY